MILKDILLRLLVFARKQYGHQVNMSKISKRIQMHPKRNL